SGYELEVAGDETMLHQTLQTIPSIQTIDPVDTELPPDRHKVRVMGESGTSLAGQEIAAAIVKAGLGLHEMRRIQASLEDVFLQLTTEETPLPEGSPETPPPNS
ncbi:MAG: ABC transporter ATP-binding protein, partial [Leptodesmis sp.]